MSDYFESMQVVEDTQKNKYLTFSIGEEVFGIEIRYVTEIIKHQEITDIPDVEDYIKGVINLRGKIIPVMDMRLRFNKIEKEYHDRTCIIVVDVCDITMGFIVDTVAEVILIPEENVVPPPEINNKKHKYVKAIGKIDSEVQLILDCEKLVTENV